MKTLNEKAVRILAALLKLPQPTKYGTHDTARELHAKVAHDIGRYRIINITAYRNEEEWQTREPELTILHDTLTDEYIPSNIVNDYAHINSNSANIYGGVLTVWNDKIQSDHADFANRWLENLAEQYGIDI